MAQRITTVLWCLVIFSTASSLDYARAQTAADADGDGVVNEVDNCVFAANPAQEDSDADTIGDACDRCEASTPDVPDSLGVLRLVTDITGCAIHQLCPCSGPPGPRTWPNRRTYLSCVRTKAKAFHRARKMGAAEQRAVLRIARASSCGVVRGRAGDMDGDGIPDDGDHSDIAGDHSCKAGGTTACDDNCRRIRNRKQRDRDGDGKGDPCDKDLDGDRVPNTRDNCPRVSNAGQDDGDNDGVGDVCDKCQDTPEEDDVDSKGCS